LPDNINRSNLRFICNTTDLEGNIWFRIVSGNEPYLIFNRTSLLYSIQLSSDPPHALFFGKDKNVQAFEDRLVYKDLKRNQTHTVIKKINKKRFGSILTMAFGIITEGYG